MKKVSSIRWESTHRFANDVYSVPIGEAYLIYSPLRRIAALVNKKALYSIKEELENGVTHNKAPAELKSICVELQKPIQEIPVERTGPVEPAFLGIVPTRACNLSCLYCGFGARSASKEFMDLHMAVSAVEWMAERVRHLGKETLEIHFFGGEPFVAQEVVDVVIHRSRAVAGQLGLVPHFEVSTNGVFDEDRAHFVGDYFDAVVLSFDGPQEIHDRNRPISRDRGSFEAVARTAHRLSQSPTELCFRTCITQESVMQMENIARWFLETFQPSTIDFETLYSTPESEAAGLKPPNPYDFAIHCVRASWTIESCGVQAVYASACTGIPRLSFCPVGQDTLIVSPDGRLSGCYLPDWEWKARGMDMDVGCVKSGGSVNIDLEAIQRLRRLVTDKPRCERCFCRWTCAGGCHVNHSYPDCSRDYDEFCIQTRIITACFLLKDLGMMHVAEGLIEDRTAMEALSMHPTDCLEEWEE